MQSPKAVTSNIKNKLVLSSAFVQQNIYNTSKWEGYIDIILKIKLFIKICSPLQRWNILVF